MAKQLKNGSTHGHLPAIALDLKTAEVVNPYNIGPVYSNNAAILMGQHDLRILFSEVVLASPNGQAPKVELRANITMAPTQFKAFADAVAQTLGAFEKQFGEIKWPPRRP